MILKYESLRCAPSLVFSVDISGNSLKIVNFNIEQPLPADCGRVIVLQSVPLHCNDTPHHTRDTQMEIVLNLNFPIVDTPLPLVCPAVIMNREITRSKHSK